MRHKLKIQKRYSDKYFLGVNFWELRLNDRNFNIGDILDFTVIETNYRYSVTIVDIFDNSEFGLGEGWVVLSLATSYVRNSVTLSV